MTVTPVAPSGADIQVSPAFLTFTTSTWGAPQTVTVKTTADADAASDEDVVIAHQVAAPEGYELTVPDVTVMITELNTRSVTVAPTALTITEGQSGTYSVVLTSEPTGPVSVISHGSTGHGRVT